MKLIANYISIARTFFIFVLFLVKPLSIEFYFIYFLCGMSDIMDGYIARKTDTVSDFGAKLDSVADLSMVIVVCIILFPIINITANIFYWIILIILIRVLSMITVFVKYKTFGILHTIGNKITGIMLFLFPVIIKSEMLIYVLCSIASMSAVEEFIIHIVSKELHVNRMSIFR